MQEQLQKPREKYSNLGEEILACTGAVGKGTPCLLAINSVDHVSVPIIVQPTLKRLREV